ncbi:MAG: phosphatidate cytidylyltransferase [Actinomycetota bacterium]|nr:phosphatidate cytidylyltransferase [Actinomycetota bacterium]
MADDKREGDDLFEDLDKFFAPIKDVDWDEPAETGVGASPSEEHVSVHGTTSAPDEPAQTPPPPLIGELPESETDEPDAAWYDTSVMAPIDDLLGEGEEDIDETTVPAGLDAELRGGQADLFDPSAGEEGADLMYLPDDEPDVRVSRETQPMPAFLNEPSDAEVREAVEHFGGTLERDPRTEAVVPFEDGEDDDVVIGGSDPEAGDDLLAEPGAVAVEDDILADMDEADGAPRTVIVGADEGLGGPSWQEPTSVEVGAELDRRGGAGGERDVPAAFMTGLVLAGLSLGSLLIGTGAFWILATVIVLVAQGELFGVMVKHKYQPATAVGLVSGVLMMAGAYYHGEPGLLAMFALGTIATFLWFMTVPPAHRSHLLQNIGLTIFNMAWIPLLAGYLVALLHVGNVTESKKLVFSVIALTFIYDTFAFLIGSVWGGTWVERPLAPNTSPKKSWEGFIGALVVTLIVAMVLMPSLVSVFTDHKLDAALLGIVVGLAATFGDLAESLVKRDMGIKDMGSILPGHGGILDRIDSLLFVAPAAFLVIRIVFG